MESRFHWVDYLLFAAVLLLSMGIGVWAAFTGGGQKTTKQYLMANHNLRLFPVRVTHSNTSTIWLSDNQAEVGTQEDHARMFQYVICLLGFVRGESSAGT